MSCQKVGSAQVLAVWQWWNWLLRFQERAKPLLIVNWDETACRLHYPTGKGMCARRVSRSSQRLRQLTQSVPTARKRGSLTHVGLICNDTSLQPVLPQIIIGNEHTLTTKELTAIGEGVLPPNVQVWKRKSAWVNKDTMRDILREIWRSLRAHQDRRQVVLLLDTYPAHMDPNFLQNCNRKKIWVVFVPAKQTWLLNPLDTHTFGVYKQYLRKDYRRLLGERPQASVTVADMVFGIGRAVKHVLHAKTWHTAFEQNGFGTSTGPRCARTSILENLEWSETPVVSSALPSLSQFEAVMPARASLPLSELTAPFRGRVPAGFGNICAGAGGEQSPQAFRECDKHVRVSDPAAFASSCAPLAVAGASLAASSSAAPCPVTSPTTAAPMPKPTLPRRQPVGRPLLLRRQSSSLH